MNAPIDKASYEQAIMFYLQDKYHEAFTVTDIHQSFSGDVGGYIRANCVREDDSNLFYVRCYWDPAYTPNTLDIGGRLHSIEDSYTEILCSKQFLPELPGCPLEKCVIRCRVEFYNRQPTMEEYAEGLHACLRNKNLRAYLKVYILCDGNAQTQELYHQVEKLVASCNPDTGYIYFAAVKNFDLTYAEQLYHDHQYDFGNYLAQREYADQLWFTAYKTETGLCAKEMVKG